MDTGTARNNPSSVMLGKERSAMTQQVVLCPELPPS